MPMRFKRRGDVLVGPSPGHAAHDSHRVIRRAAAVLARAWLAHPQLRVLAAAPVNRQYDFARCVVDIDDDVLDEGSQQLLTRAHGHAGRIPGCVEIFGESAEVRGGVQDQRCSSRPIAPDKLARAVAPPPSSSRVARRSNDCRGRMPRSVAPRARPRSGPAATPAPRCDVDRLNFPCASVPLPVQLRSPSARRRAPARERQLHRHAAAEDQTPRLPSI